MGRLSLLCFSLLALGSSAQRDSGATNGGESVKGNSQSANGLRHEIDFVLDYAFATTTGATLPTNASPAPAAGTPGPSYNLDGNTTSNNESAKLKEGIEQWCHKNGHSHSHNSPGGFNKHGKCVDYHPLGSCAAKHTHLNGACQSYEPHNTRVGLMKNEANHTKFVETQGWKNMVDSSRCTWIPAAGVNPAKCAANASADCGAAAKQANEAACNDPDATVQTCRWAAKGFCIPLILKKDSFDGATQLLTSCNGKSEDSCSVMSIHGTPAFNYCIWVDQQASWGDTEFTDDSLAATGANYPPAADFPASRSDYADLPKVCRSKADTASCGAKNNTGGQNTALKNKAECIADSACDWVGCGNNACGIDNPSTGVNESLEWVSVSCVATEVCDNESITDPNENGATYAQKKAGTKTDPQAADPTQIINGQTAAQRTCEENKTKTACEADKNCTFDKYTGLKGTCNAIECRSVSVGNCHPAQPNKPDHCKVQPLHESATAYKGRAGVACSTHSGAGAFGGNDLARTTSQSDVDAAKKNCLTPKTTNADPLFKATGGQLAPGETGPTVNACEWIEAGQCGDACKSGKDQAGCIGHSGDPQNTDTCEWIFQAQNAAGGAECNPQANAAYNGCAGNAHIGDADTDNNVGGNGAPSAGTFRLSGFPSGELQVSLGVATNGVAEWYTVCTDTWNLATQYSDVANDTYHYWCQALGYPLGAHTGNNTTTPANTGAQAGKGYIGTLSACSDTTGSLGATCTSDKNPINWSSAQASNSACTSALELTCLGPRGGYKHNVLPGLRANIARHCDFSPIQIAHARVLSVAGGTVTAALRLATKTYCTGNCNGGDATADANAEFAYFDKGSIQTSVIFQKAMNAFDTQFSKGLKIWARDGGDYGFDNTTVTVSRIGTPTTWSGNVTAVGQIYSVADINSWPLIGGGSDTQWGKLKMTFAHIDNNDSDKLCTVLNKLAIYNDACPRGGPSSGTYTAEETKIKDVYVPAAALDAYINGDRQYYPDKVCNFVKNNTNGTEKGPNADIAACDAAFDCMRDKSGGSATSEEVERCSLNVLADHYGKTIDELMGTLDANTPDIDVSDASASGTLKTATFSSTQWAYARNNAGTVNLIQAANYSNAIRDAWLDSFSEHNNWTDKGAKLCTSDTVAFRELLTNTNGDLVGTNGPQGPFVAGFDKAYSSGGLVGSGNGAATRSNRYGWQHPRCTSDAGAKKYGYIADAGLIHDDGSGATPAGERVVELTNIESEGGQNYGHNYRGPPSLCTGMTGKKFEYNRVKGGCTAKAADSPTPCANFSADAAKCATSGCVYTGAACEGIERGCAAHTTQAACTAVNCDWNESRATLGTVSSLGQCKRLCRGNIDCQAITVTSWAPPQNWSDGTASTVGAAYAAACKTVNGSNSADDDSCKGSKTASPEDKHTKICVLCPHTPPATLAAPAPETATGAGSQWQTFLTGGTTTYVRSGRGSSRQMAVYDITLYAGAKAAGNSVNLVKEAGGRQLRRSLQAEKPKVKVVASSSEVDEEQFQEAMKDVMRANPHLRRFLAEEKVYPQRDEVIESAPTATATTTSAAAPTGPQAQNTSNTQSENVKSASEEESMNSASRIITTSMIAIMSLYALLQ